MPKDVKDLGFELEGQGFGRLAAHDAALFGIVVVCHRRVGLLLWKKPGAEAPGKMLLGCRF
jgi:hypothetical protein